METHYKGCGVYYNLLQIALDRSQRQDLNRLSGFSDARYHREHCIECAKINTTLEEQLFGRKVNVSNS